MCWIRGKQKFYHASGSSSKSQGLRILRHRPLVIALHLHELVNRGRTVSHAELRELSYAPELTILLCEECHNLAHNPFWRGLLFRSNYRRYGYEQVRAAFDELRAAAERSGRTLDIDLPSEENDDESA